MTMLSDKRMALRRYFEARCPAAKWVSYKTLLLPVRGDDREDRVRYVFKPTVIRKERGRPGGTWTRVSSFSISALYKELRAKGEL